MERVKKCRYPERKICNIYAEMQQICNAICISEVYVRQKRLESQGSTQEYRSLYSLTHWETINKLYPSIEECIMDFKK